MKESTKTILLTAAGVFAGGLIMKKFKTPFIPIAALAGGIILHSKSKNASLKAFATGIAAIGAVGTIGKIAEKVESLQQFTPTISGLGELYQDENGNTYMMGVNGPELVQDENGNTYMMEGIDGNMEDLLAGDEYDDDEDLEGLDGSSLTRLVA